jgi:hypothetical protein
MMGVSTNSTQPGAASPSGNQAHTERPFHELVVELWENTEKLIHQELALASAEIDLKVDRLKMEATSTAIAAGLLLLGASCAVAALVLLLSKVMDPFLAALLVALALGATGSVLLKRKKPTAEELLPERTIENLKKDVDTFTEAKP